MADRHALYVADKEGWLASYDPDGGDPSLAYPTGTFSVTTDPAQALRFRDGGAALEFWRQQSKRTPLRPDGKPNRPLCAFTVVVKEVPFAG